MNPNSNNQVWSKWTFDIRPQKHVSMQWVKSNCARFGRKMFGSASEMRISYQNGVWKIEIRTEGAPVQDVRFVQYIEQIWNKFLLAGFGGDANVCTTMKLEAGNKQDGTPSDQLVMVPPIVIEELVNE